MSPIVRGGKGQVSDRAGPIAIEMTSRAEDGRRDTPKGPRRRFLSVWFRCCHVYGRMYRNAAQTAYHGRCPRCGAPVRAIIGAGGTKHRIFRTE